MADGKLTAFAVICVLGCSTTAYAQSEQNRAIANDRVSALEKDNAALSEAMKELKGELETLKSQIADEQKIPVKNDAEKSAAAPAVADNNLAPLGAAGARNPIGSLPKNDPTPTGIATAAIPDSHKGNSASAQLVTSQTSSIASLTFSHSTKQLGSNIGTLSVVASTPLSTGSESTNLYSLDGLSSGTKIAIGYTLFHRHKIGLNDQIDNAAQDECEKDNGKKLNLASSADCKSADAYNKRKAYLSSDQVFQYEKDLAHDLYAGDWSIGINGAASYTKYTFYPITRLTKTTEDRIPWNIGATLSYFVSPYGAISFTANYTRKFTSGDSVITCPVSPSKSTVTCANGPISAPTLSDTGIMTAEYRQLVFLSENGFIKYLGISPKFSYDIVAHTYEVDGPVYLVPDSSENLTGGINFQYLSKTNSFSVGLFIGTKFSVGE